MLFRFFVYLHDDRGADPTSVQPLATTPDA
jgi:hypothetical protein